MGSFLHWNSQILALEFLAKVPKIQMVYVFMMKFKLVALETWALLP
jgi:hypothetical protein